MYVEKKKLFLHKEGKNGPRSMKYKDLKEQIGKKKK